MNNFKKLTTASYLVAAALVLSGCEFLSPRPIARRPLPPLNTHFTQPDNFQELKNETIPAKLRTKIELFPTRNQFSEPPPVASHKRTVTNGLGTYSLNFDEADLGEVAKVILSDILGQNYVLSPKVAGKVTLQTTQPLTKEELIPTLEMVLRMNNAALVKDGKIFHIEPSTDALYTSDITTGSGAKAGYQTRVITIKNVNVQNIADIIKPLVRDKTILQIDPSRNAMVIAGTPDELSRIMDMINTFDIDVLRGRSFALFSLAHAPIDKVIEELNVIFQKKGGKGDSSEFFSFLPIERMNAVLAITHQASYLRDVEDWVIRLDKANSDTGGGVHVYKVQHMDAVDLADQLNQIFGNGGGSSSRSKAGKVAPGQSSGTMTNSSGFGGSSGGSSSFGDSSGGSSSLGGASGSSSSFGDSSTDSGSSSGGSSFGGTTSVSKSSSGGSRSSGSSGSARVANVGDIKIVSDETNNALVIVSTPREYAIILPIIKQLDIMPLQVLIDATIADVNLTDNLEYGIQWYLNNGAAGASFRGAPSTTAGVAGSTPRGVNLMNLAAGYATGGLSYSFLSSSGDVQMLLKAEASLGNVDVISSPSLMVLNNQEANIQVGDEISLSAGGINTSTGNGVATVTQNIQRKTGVKLKVRPRVNANGMVIMDIDQSIENVKANTVPNGTGNPTIAARSITSTVAVQDGETLVLGGLITETNSNNKTGIPFLHRLPLIGPLFGNTFIDKQRTELVILLTPRVVKSQQDSRIVSDEFRRKLTGIYDVPGTYRKKEWYYRD